MTNLWLSCNNLWLRVEFLFDCSCIVMRPLSCLEVSVFISLWWSIIESAETTLWHWGHMIHMALRAWVRTNRYKYCSELAQVCSWLQQSHNRRRMMQRYSTGPGRYSSDMFVHGLSGKLKAQGRLCVFIFFVFSFQDRRVKSVNCYNTCSNYCKLIWIFW